MPLANNQAPLSLPLSKKVSQTNNPVFDKQLLHPRHWMMWLLMGCWWLLVQLPYPVLMRLGKMVGRVLGVVEKNRISITRHNLELCFPEFSPIERSRLMRETFESAGIALFETAISWWWPNHRLKKIIRVNGLEHLQQAKNKSVILLGMHFTPLDIGIAALSLHHSYGVMYRPHRNPVFNYVQFYGRSRFKHKPPFLSTPFPRQNLRTMIRLLRNGTPVWYAPDQDYGPDHSVFVPFFGVPAATITTTARLAHLVDALVIPHTIKRLPQYQGYEITLHPPLQDFPSGEDTADAIRINNIIETQVKQNPGQYLWAHRRFKTRTANMPERYPDIVAKKLALRKKQWARKRKSKQQRAQRQKSIDRFL